ncbi:retropepsin-like aspartic protease [Maricaulis sp.]|uniref:retropepsin-like aspartic protease n=1 Tax=unclassified Maricaulis TaxID=2632371 RepID=UPI001B0FC642|nr:retropepsin-like aspartic protease [Maricaulis sp.]MBO6797591.1 clan AA aspartic protease [Maricaulis sp.]
MKPSDRLTRALALGLGLAWLPAPALPQTIELGRTVSGHVIMDVEVGEHGEHVFVVDTGANRTAIAQAVAEQMGFQSSWVVSDDVQSLTRMFEAERFELADVRLPHIPPQTLQSVVIPDSTTRNTMIAGLLGMDAFAGRRYGIDFTDGHIQLEPEHVFFDDGILDPENGLLYGAARLGTGERIFRVVIDSGSAVSIANHALHSRFVPRNVLSYELSGVDGRMGDNANAFPIRQFQIGDLCISRQYIMRANLDIFYALGWENAPALVIGMDILSQARVTIDQRTGVWDIQPTGRENQCRNDDRIQLSDLEELSH